MILRIVVVINIATVAGVVCVDGVRNRIPVRVNIRRIGIAVGSAVRMMVFASVV